MDIVAHKKIHSFNFDGIIKDNKDIFRLRQKYDQICEDFMRSKGYVPQLDLDPVFTIEYNGVAFEFKYTRYGIYIGKAKAKCFKAVTGTRLIPETPMRQDRCEKSSYNVASQ